jgi:hypothetical protein
MLHDYDEYYELDNDDSISERYHGEGQDAQADIEMSREYIDSITLEHVTL